MLISIIIKILFICIGLFFAILSTISMTKRNVTPMFTIIWLVFSLILILTGIFIEPYGWANYIGLPTLVFACILGITFIIFLWFLTKNIDELQHKFKEVVIQLTLLRDENKLLKDKINNAKKTFDEAKGIIQSNQNPYQIVNMNLFNIHNKKILLVNNTLSTGGAEKSLINLMDVLLENGNNVHLFIITGMGELIKKIPKGVKLLNENFDQTSVLTAEGKKILTKKVLRAQKDNFTGLRLFKYSTTAFANMIKNGKINSEKLVWRALAQTAPIINYEYDIAIAYTEGASTYYVAENVVSKSKIAYVHTDFVKSGYTKQLDQDSYNYIDKIFAVSENVRKSFIKVHPECINKVYLSENIIDKEEIINLSREKIKNNTLWNDNVKDQIKILSVGRLVKLKSYDLIIDTALKLKKNGLNFSWIILGEGEEHKNIQQKINNSHLANNVYLFGNVDNPYSYMSESDVFVHVSHYEGKSIAITEAKILGCAIILSNTSSKANQITDGYDGLICNLNSNDIKDKILYLTNNPQIANNLKNHAIKSSVENF